MDDCIFCKIVAGKIPCAKIWEDDKFLAFLDINPIKPGHTLLIPKAHVDNIFHMDETNYSDIWKKAKTLSKPLQDATGAERIGIAVEGFLVPHAHIHLVPLHNGGELEPSKARKATPEDLQEIAQKIKIQCNGISIKLI